MLNNAAEPHAGQLSAIVERAAAELTVLGSLEESDLADTRVLYIATYALIRIGNTIAKHSRQLELAYPEYRWVFWVDLRNELAHEEVINVARVWHTLSQGLPNLIQSITGQPLP